MKGKKDYSCLRKSFGQQQKKYIKKLVCAIFAVFLGTAAPVCAMQFGGFDVAVSNGTYAGEWQQVNENIQWTYSYAEQEQYAWEQAEQERQMQEQYAREQAEQERQRQEQYAREQAEQERQRQEQYAREQAEQERLRQEQYIREQREQERLQQEQYIREQEEQIRQQYSNNSVRDNIIMQAEDPHGQETVIPQTPPISLMPTPPLIPEQTLTIVPSSMPDEQKKRKLLSPTPGADSKTKMEQAALERNEPESHKKAEIHFSHRKNVPKDKSLKIRIQAEGVVSILSFRVNHKECPWHWEGNYVIADIKIQEGEQVIELLAIDGNGNVACMEPWFFDYC